MRYLELKGLSKELEPFLIKRKDVDRLVLFADFIRSL